MIEINLLERNVSSVDSAVLRTKLYVLTYVVSLLVVVLTELSFFLLVLLHWAGLIRAELPTLKLRV